MTFCVLCGQTLGREAPPAHAKCAAAEQTAPPGPAGPMGSVLDATDATNAWERSAPHDQAPRQPISTVPGFEALSGATGRPVAKPATAVKPEVWRPRISWDGRPRSYPSVWRWISSAMFRNWRGVVASILCGWFQVPFIVIMAALGAILGGLVGAVSGTAFGPGVTDRLNVFTQWIFPLPLPGGIGDLLPTAALQIGGIIGMIWGAISGALNLGWLATYFPWLMLYEGDPSWPVQLFIGQIVTALFVGTLYTVWSIATEGSRLKMGGARQMSRREEAWIRPILEDCAARLNLPGIPRLYVTDSREVNAYAMTRTLVVHRGLLEHLNHNREDVAGVLAHELTHWSNGDSVSRIFCKGVGLPLYILYEIAYKLLQASQRVRPVQWLLRILLWGVTTTVRFIVGPANAAAWRREEFRADQGAAAAGYSEGLRRALSSFSDSFDGGSDGWDEVMLRSHPSNELRMERLELPGKAYPLVSEDGGSATTVDADSSASSSTVPRGW